MTKTGRAPSLTVTSLTVTSAEQLSEMFDRMALIREFDSMLPGLYDQGLVRGSSHAAIGQAVAGAGVRAGAATTPATTSPVRTGAMVTRSPRAGMSSG